MSADAVLPPNPFVGLPDEIFTEICAAYVIEYATFTTKGVPLDTPTYGFVAADGTSVDLATGLAYPIKAERARRNPKVGLLIEAGAGRPVISIAAYATVRDSDFQANADRYTSEICRYEEQNPNAHPWSVRRQAIWYWTRILVECRPKRIRWWCDPTGLDQSPQVWDAPKSAIFPPSDPAAALQGSTAPDWGKRDWRELARPFVERGMPAHVSAVDDQGFPLPFRARRCVMQDDGFALDIPAGAPWKPVGSASLTYNGRATFVGELVAADEGTRFIVERALPVLPMVADPRETYAPSDATRSRLMNRLDQELNRRGQKPPLIGESLPEPTPVSQLRAERMATSTEDNLPRRGVSQGALDHARSNHRCARENP